MRYYNKEDREQSLVLGITYLHLCGPVYQKSLPASEESDTAQAKPDNHKNRKIDGPDFLSAEGMPCPHWSTIKTDQAGRRRQVLVVHSRGSTLARTRRAVKKAFGGCRMNTSMKDLFGD
jgi:hypothetical protein